MILTRYSFPGKIRRSAVALINRCRRTAHNVGPCCIVARVSSDMTNPTLSSANVFRINYAARYKTLVNVYYNLFQP